MSIKTGHNVEIDYNSEVTPVLEKMVDLAYDSNGSVEATAKAELRITWGGRQKDVDVFEEEYGGDFTGSVILKLEGGRYILTIDGTDFDEVDATGKSIPLDDCHTVIYALKKK